MTYNSIPRKNLITCMLAKLANLDNIFIERLWWTVKHEWVYLRPCDNGIEQKRSLEQCFEWYNRRRPHQSLDWQTPDEAYFASLTQTKPLAA